MIEVITPRRFGTITSWPGIRRVKRSGAPPTDLGVTRIDRFPTRSTSTGDPVEVSEGDRSQMTVSPGAAKAGATRPSSRSPATTDPTACTQPDPLACATPVQTNKSRIVPATGPKARSGKARLRT